MRHLSRPPKTPFPILNSWLEEVYNHALASVPIQSRGTKITRTARGSAIQVDIPDANTFKLQQLQLQKIHDDYLECFSWDGTQADETKTIYVAKPHDLRKTGWDGQTINGISYVFDATDSTARTATDGSSASQVERVTPDYVEGFSIIIAAKVGSILNVTVPGDPNAVPPTSDKPVTLLDLNDGGRAWAKV